MKIIRLLLAIICLPFYVFGQSARIDSLQLYNRPKFKYTGLIVPSVLLGYGIIGLESHALRNLNTSTRDELKEHIDAKFTVDDISQYSPFVAVYALNALHTTGKSNLTDRTIILSTAYLIMGATVNSIKYTGDVKRPDGSSTNSFPSGHTATAFMGAEFLFQEYKDVSVWYGIAGYAVAAGTGFFRMYNNRHWLTDVAAGAGIGIFSTKAAYLLHPLVKNVLFRNHKKLNGMLLPFYDSKAYGLGACMTF